MAFELIHIGIAAISSGASVFGYYSYSQRISQKGHLVSYPKNPLQKPFKKWMRKRALKGEMAFVNFLSSVPILGIWVGINPANLELGLSVLAGSMIGLGAWMSPILRKAREKFQLPVAIEAAKRIALSENPESSQTTFLQLSESKEAAKRQVAIEGLKFIGTKTAYDRISKLQNDPKEQVSNLAQKVVRQLDGPIHGKDILSVRPMETYRKEHEYWMKRAKMRDNPKQGEAMDKLAESVLALDEIVLSQMPLWRAYPDIFCMECYARTEQLQYLDWKWVRCKTCLDVHNVRNGVDRVIGEIGGNGLERMEGRTLIVPLWNESEKQALAIDADEIHVLPEEGINLDWAIAAVVSKLKNQKSNAEWRTKVICPANLPLEPNSRALLQTIDPSFGHEQRLPSLEH